MCTISLQSLRIHGRQLIHTNPKEQTKRNKLDINVFRPILCVITV